jgi:hypothetical protein
MSHAIRGKDGENATQDTIDRNNEEAVRVGTELRRVCRDLDIYIPAETDMYLLTQGVDVSHLIGYEVIIALDKKVVESRDLLLVYIPDGYISEGMKEEIECAKLLGIPIFYFSSTDSHEELNNIVRTIIKLKDKTNG